MKCVFCNKEIGTENLFCPYCGKKQKKDTVDQKTETVFHPYQSSNKTTGSQEASSNNPSNNTEDHTDEKEYAESAGTSSKTGPTTDDSSNANSKSNVREIYDLYKEDKDTFNKFKGEFIHEFKNLHRRSKPKKTYYMTFAFAKLLKYLGILISIILFAVLMSFCENYLGSTEGSIFWLCLLIAAVPGIIGWLLNQFITVVFDISNTTQNIDEDIIDLSEKQLQLDMKIAEEISKTNTLLEKLLEEKEK